MNITIVLIMLLMVPLGWAFVLLWKERKKFHSLVPFILGAAFIGIARLLDVPMEIPSLQLHNLFGLTREHLNPFFTALGDIADILGVIFLMVGFSQTIKLLTLTEKKIRTLESMLPLCAWCKKIRTEDGAWKTVESYLEAAGAPRITHGVCPECAKKMVDDYRRRVK